MDQTTITRISILITIFMLLAITGVVTTIIRRTPSVAKRKATYTDVLFVVCQRSWQSIMVRTFGILCIIAGCVMLLVGIISQTSDSALGMGIVGGIFALLGILVVWVAHGMTRMGLEVMEDAIWVFPMTGSPRKVELSEVTKLDKLVSNNYGGIVVRSDKRVLFKVTRLMLGYPQLIEYFQSHRPDLEIPAASYPLQ